jgi:(4S)-4-hydroxy-5-phosphonooxypentane-2,3-dione isomerase
VIGAYVITVEFVVQREHVARFAELLFDNARTSLSAEAGCRVFDVCTWAQDDTRFFLYEVYDDAAAFEQHLASPHFKAFDAEVRPWVATKAVQALDRHLL